MKYRIVVILCIALGLLVSCNTTRPIWFIATPGYVDNQIAESEEAMRLEYEALLVEKDREIARLRRQLDEQQAVAEELASLIDMIRDVDASNRELQDLAGAVETRLDQIPNETIEILVQLLSRHLEGQGRGAP